MPPKPRPYCYVDETGQDTGRELFIVSVVLTEGEQDRLFEICEAIELDVGKWGKWVKTSYPVKLAYIQRILTTEDLCGRLYFARYFNTTEHLRLTVRTISGSLRRHRMTDRKANVLIDALPRPSQTKVSNELHNMGIRTEKVKGVKKDENNSLIRLADAICGLVREAYEGRPEMRNLVARGIRTGYLIDLESNEDPA
jgi:hypothetical protein